MTEQPIGQKKTGSIYEKFEPIITLSQSLTIALLAGVWGVLPADLHAAEQNQWLRNGCSHHRMKP